MTKADLERLVAIGQLKSEPPDAGEFAGLVRSGCARFVDAQRRDLALESRFDLAYNAAHSLCLAALRWHGYRSTRRYTVFQTLDHTLGIDAAQWRVLDAAHQRRNRSEYEGVTEVDDALLEAMLRVLRVVSERLAALGPIR